MSDDEPVIEPVPDCAICGKPLLDEPCSLYHASQRLGWACLEYGRQVGTVLKPYLDRWAGLLPHSDISDTGRSEGDA